MKILQLIKIDKDDKETILEVTSVPDSFVDSTCFYSYDHIRKMEEHYKRTGRPKKSYIDVIYITRRQVERE